MKLHLTRSEGRNLFTGYGAGYVSVNDRRYERPIVVAPEEAVTDWDAPNFEALTRAHVEALLALAPEIVLLGTGERLRFPRPELMRVFAEAHVGVEVMDTKATCRTFNVLMAEGRRVVAALFV